MMRPLSLNRFIPWLLDYIFIGKLKSVFLSTTEHRSLNNHLNKLKFEEKMSIRKMEESDIADCTLLCEESIHLNRYNDIEGHLEHAFVVVSVTQEIVGYTTGCTLEGHSVALTPNIFKLLALHMLLHTKKVSPFCFLISSNNPALPFFLNVEAFSVLDRVSVWCRGRFPNVPHTFYPSYCY